MSAQPTPVIPHYNPFDQVHKRNPYPFWKEAREQTPVFFSPILNMWVVTRYEDILTVLREPHIYSSGQNIDSVMQMPPDVLEVMAQGRPPSTLIINLDPPAHNRLRGLVNKGFTPQRVNGMEGKIRQLVNDFIDGFVHEGQAEIIGRFAYPMPRIVIGDIVGVPREDINFWGKLVDSWASFLLEDVPHEKQIEGAQSMLKLQAYNDKMIAERSQTPRDDLLSDLIHARLDDGSALTIDELNGIMVTLLVAGHNTVTDFIGNACIVMSENPEVYQRLAAEPEIAADVVEEILRLESPAPGLFRGTTQDVTLGGVDIPKGSRLYVLYGSANRDEAVFNNADQFDLQRNNLGNHLALGRGIHYCVGAPLARLEGKIVLQEFAKRLPNLRVLPDQTPDYKLNPTFRGPLTLNVAWDI